MEPSFTCKTLVETSNVISGPNQVMLFDRICTRRSSLISWAPEADGVPKRQRRRVSHVNKTSIKLSGKSSLIQ